MPESTRLFASWYESSKVLKNVSRSPTHLAHPLEDEPAVVIHVIGPSLQGNGGANSWIRCDCQRSMDSVGISLGSNPYRSCSG